jgi:hypothetical protein
MGRLSVQLQTKNSMLGIDGFIRFFAIRRGANTNFAREAEEMKKHFADFLGINVTGLISSNKIPDVHKRFVFSRLEIYKASYKKEGHNDPEVQLAVLGDKDWYVFIYMITPREQDNLFTWGRNVRTLELILQSIR